MFVDCHSELDSESLPLESIAMTAGFMIADSNVGSCFGY